MRTLMNHAAAATLLCFAFACSSSSGSGDGSQPGPSTTANDTGETAGDGSSADNPCGIDSGYPGDEFCIPPPDPTEGLQLWVGPSDYDNPDEVASYLLESGGEDVVCFNTDPVDTAGFYYLEQRNRMRSGSHHMLIALKTADGRERGRVTDQAECDGFADRVGSIPGSQTPINDFLTEDFAPEDMGLGRWFPGDAIAQFQLHYVNTRDETVMREAWINLTYRDEADVTDALNTIFLVGDLAVAVPAQTRQTTALSYTPELPEETRIFELTGHSHAHTERVSIFKNRDTPDELLMYESYNWSEPAVLRFNSVIDNPAPDPTGLSDGGTTGPLFLEPGDSVDFECEVNNTTDQVLHFANEAYTAEMCLAIGAYVGDQAGLLSGMCAAGNCSGFSANTAAQ
jgi:hypothetical protein